MKMVWSRLRGLLSGIGGFEGIGVVSSPFEVVSGLQRGNRRSKREH